VATALLGGIYPARRSAKKSIARAIGTGDLG